jgi:hypothetical protein
MKEEEGGGGDGCQICEKLERMKCCCLMMTDDDEGEASAAPSGPLFWPNYHAERNALNPANKAAE